MNIYSGSHQLRWLLFSVVIMAVANFFACAEGEMKTEGEQNISEDTQAGSQDGLQEGLPEGLPNGLQAKIVYYAMPG